MRGELAERKLVPWSKRMAMWLTSHVLRRPRLYRLMGGALRVALRWTPRWLLYLPLNAWGRQRELPAAPRRSFRAQFRGRRE